MKKGIIIVLVILTLLVAGCGQKIEIKVEPTETEETKPVCDEDGECEGKEECSCIDCKEKFECRKQELVEDEYLLRKEGSEKIAGKTLTFLDLDSSGRTKISVDEKTATIEKTKTKEIVNMLEVTVLETEYNVKKEDTIVKLLVNKYEPGTDEYLFEQIGAEQIVQSVRVRLNTVEVSTPKNFVRLDVGNAINQKIREEETQTIEGLKITLVKAYPKGIPVESYAILKIEKA